MTMADPIPIIGQSFYQRLNYPIVAPATATAHAAIALIRISGTDLHEIYQNLFASEKLPAARRACRCDLYDQSQQLIDQVIVTYFKGPSSYSGEDMLEISCHGNPLIIMQICKRVQALGALEAKPGEFTCRALHHNKLEVCQAQAINDLICANNQQSIEKIKNNLQGSLTTQINILLEQISNLQALITVLIDFSDEDDISSQQQQLQIQIEEKITNLANQIEQMIKLGAWQQKLFNGINLAIIGRPNAGKSTLFNLLCQEQAALVHTKPGTTRDALQRDIWLQNGKYHLRLFDTAGLRDSDNDEVENAGMDKTKQLSQKADMLLLLIDATSIDQTNLDLLPKNQQDQSLLIVLNKHDLAPTDEVPIWLQPYQHLYISALQQTGIDTLYTKITNIIEGLNEQQQFKQNQYHLNQEQLSELAECQHQLSQCLNCLPALEISAEHLKAAQAALAGMLSIDSQERLYDKIFNKFCLGK